MQTGSGFIWSNRNGDQIYYDRNGHITAYVDRNGVKVSLERNDRQQIVAIRDHFGQSLLEVAYQGNYPVHVTDHSDRAVSYQWEGSKLTQVTDIDGHHWHYGYDTRTFKGKHYLASITTPENQTTILTNVPSVAGLVDTGSTNIKLGKGSSSGNTAIRTGSVIAAESMPILTGTTYPDGKYVRYRSLYDIDSERYTSITVTSDGSETQTVFDRSGKPAEIMLGGKRLYTQVKSGNRRVILDGLNHRTEILYDQWDNPTRITYPDGSTEGIRYHHRFNRPVEHKDRQGNHTRYRYDEHGNLTELTEAIGLPGQRITNFSYDAHGQLIQLTIAADDESAAVTRQYQYDNYGNLTRYTDGRNIQWTFKDYTADGQPQVVVDGKKQARQYQYLPSGKLSQVTSAMGHVWQYRYNKNGELTETIDPLKQSSQYTYDARGHQTSVTDSLGLLRQIRHRMDGRIQQLTDGENRSQHFNYDRQQRLKSIRDDEGNLTEYRYQGEEQTAMHWLAGIKRPEGDISYRYNALGQGTHIQQNSLTGQESLTQHLRYNHGSQPYSIEDPAGRTTTLDYDAFGRTLRHTDALGSITAYRYTNLGQIASITDAMGSETRYQYDGEGNLLSETLPMGQQHQYRYDGNGNLTRHINAKGEVIRYDYDGDNRLIRERWYKNETAADNSNTQKHLTDSSPESHQRQIDYHYDALGQLIRYQIHGNSGIKEQAFQYNARGELVQELSTFPGFAKTTDYAYYRNGLLKQVSAPDGNQARYLYDKANRLVVATMNRYGSVTVSQFQGQIPLNMTYPGGLKRTHQLDNFGRLSHIHIRTRDNKELETLGYSYDPAGNIVQKTTKSGTFSYRYDVLNRLTHATQPAPLKPLQYTYDAVGNRLSSAEEIHWQHNANHQLMRQGELHYQYDANGQLTSQHNQSLSNPPTRSLSYNTAGRLTEVTEGTQILASYDYDPLGRRVTRTVGNETNYYLYNHQGLLGEYDSKGQLISGYQYPPNTTWGTAPWYQKTEQGSGGGFYQHDHLGAPVMLNRKNGQVLWQGSYDAFGKVTESSSKTPNLMRFPGQRLDSATGYHYNYHRDYAPELGRYIQRDPIGLAGGVNVYGYGHQNPIMNIDPTGLWVPQLIGTVINMGYEGYNQYQTGNLNVRKLLVAGANGALGGFGSTAMRAIIFGFAAGAINTAYQEVDDVISDCQSEIDVSKIIRNSLFGGAGGLAGYGVGAIGRRIYKVPNTKVFDPTKKETVNYGSEGAAAGAAIGGMIGNQ